MSQSTRTASVQPGAHHTHRDHGRWSQQDACGAFDRGTYNHPAHHKLESFHDSDESNAATAAIGMVTFPEVTAIRIRWLMQNRAF